MKISLSILSFFILLVSCNKSSPKEPLEVLNSQFAKVWFDTVRGIPFYSKLEIKQNNTYKYVGGACTASWSSEGVWIIKNDTIILNSKKPKECVYLSEYGTMCRTRIEIQKNGPEISSKDCDTAYSYPEFEVFKNEKFYLKNDTLVHVKQNKKCEGIDIAYSMKEKKRK